MMLSFCFLFVLPPSITPFVGTQKLNLASCRTQLHTKFETHWAMLRGPYDRNLHGVLVVLLAKKLAALHLARSYIRPLSLFANVDHIQHLIDVLQGKIPVADTTILRQVLNGSVSCALIFADLGVKMNYQLFTMSIKEQLRDLEHNGYGDVDITNFKTVMGTETLRLYDQGFKRFEKLRSPVPFLDTTVTATGPWESKN